QIPFFADLLYFVIMRYLKQSSFELRRRARIANFQARHHSPQLTVEDFSLVTPGMGLHIFPWKMGTLRSGDPTIFVQVMEKQEKLWHSIHPTSGVQVNPEDVVLCSGCSCALDKCISVLANPGQNIVMPRPGFPLYRTQAEGLGIKVKSYDLKPECDWEVDLSHLEAQIDSKTAAIIIINPSNPCGSVYSRQHLLDILNIARKKFVPIIADEIYEHMVFPGEHFTSLASLSEEVPILSCSGLTKRFLVPGWRMGWIIIHDRNDIFKKGEIRQGIQKLSQRSLASNTLVQGALPGILKNTPDKFFEDTVQTLQCHAKIAYDNLEKVKGLKPIMPRGAMYIMVGIDMAHFPEFQTELQFVEQLVTEESVFCLPGKCFDYPNYMRLVVTVPEEQLHEACQRISDFCERHYQETANKSANTNTAETHTTGKTANYSCTVMMSHMATVQKDDGIRP
ncbi:hypothetical protein L9F63_016995, partial [Diploptera punctata]